MSTYNLLIDFLEKKVQGINNKIRKAHIIIDNHKFSNMDNSSDHELIKNEIDKLFLRQKIARSIFEVLLNLVKIKNKTIHHDASYLEEEIEKFMNMQIDKILNNKVVYDQDFPLYGFELFRIKLMRQYLINENFEKCSELQVENIQYDCDSLSFLDISTDSKNKTIELAEKMSFNLYQMETGPNTTLLAKEVKLMV